MWGLGKIVSAFVRGGLGNGWRRVNDATATTLGAVTHPPATDMWT